VTENLLEVRGLCVHYPVKSGIFGRSSGCVRAAHDVSFEIKRGETLGLVGESGSGKSTVGRAVLRLTQKTAGSVIFDGTDVYSLTAAQLRRMRPRMQLIFQDPYSSLQPKMNAYELIAEAVREHGIVPNDEVKDYIEAVMESCGIDPSHGRRYPREFSGGQRQRICIARAVALRPEFIVCDEVTAALDVSIQAQIINLLCDMKEKHGLSYLFISHDLELVRYICDKAAVMESGGIVEYGSNTEVFGSPKHKYTRRLLSAVDGSPKPSE